MFYFWLNSLYTLIFSPIAYGKRMTKEEIKKHTVQDNLIFLYPFLSIELKDKAMGIKLTKSKEF